MRAIIQHGYGDNVLSMEDVNKPIPGKGEVLVRVITSSINDWEVALTRGDQFIIRMMNGLRVPKTKIPGVDMAGIVIEVAEDVSGFQAGDRVYGDLSESGFGAFAEYACTKSSALAHMPDNMTFEDAAALPHAAMLAWQGLEILGIRPGNKVLINGAGGGVGSLIIQMIPKGIEVSGVDSLQKLEQMKSWGYDHVYDYAAVNFTRLNKKYDAILDVKTMQGPWDYARALKNGGCYVTVGGTIPQLLRLLAGAPLVKLIRNRSLKVLGLKPNKGLVHVSQMYEQGTLKPALDGPYPMDKIPELIPYFAKGKHVGKIIIRIPDRI